VRRERFLVAVTLIALACLGFFVFPGHTWLQSDAQIYVAILEHLDNPFVLATDLVATRPHVTYTVYDETARALRHLTGSGFREVLLGEQLVFRVLGLWGVYLIATAFGLESWAALLVAAAFGLGATVNGPAVLTFEYEPVPRGFAVMLLFLALGLAAHNRFGASGAAGALAFLYHPPTAIPFWALSAIYWLVSGRRRIALRLLIPFIAAVFLLYVSAKLQGGEREMQELFGHIDHGLAELQQMRAPYNWIEKWPADWLWQYPTLAVVAAGAWWRLRPIRNAVLRWYCLALPFLGLAMIPVSWLLLEQVRWSLMPQFQPTRAVLFTTAFAVILSAIAGARAAAESRWVEAIAWFSVVYAIPANARFLPLFLMAPTDRLAARRIVIVAVLAVTTSVAVWLLGRGKVPAYAGLAWAAAVVLPVVLIPGWGAMKNYPDLHTPELAELSAWARSATGTDDMFLFAGMEHDLAPGIFRIDALRNIYVDWKGGGQVNLLKKFAEDWWRRWDAVRQGHFATGDEERYHLLGIDYVVLRPQDTIAGHTPLFRNRLYQVYALGH
jgi:hypothetical protein